MGVGLKVLVVILNEMDIVVSKSCLVKRWHDFFAVVHHMMSCFFTSDFLVDWRGVPESLGVEAGRSGCFWIALLLLSGTTRLSWNPVTPTPHRRKNKT
jgi:hypothetical protein